jgi:hypothetical protein
MSEPKRQRQWTLHLTVTTDSPEELGAILRFLAYEWESGGKRSDFAGAGPLGDFEGEVIHRPEMAADRFRRDRGIASEPRPEVPSAPAHRPTPPGDRPTSADAGPSASLLPVSVERDGNALRPRNTGPAGSFGFPLD